MSYCINPDCPKPQNPNGTKFCQSCGTKILLAERYRAIKLIGIGGFGKTFLAQDEYKPSKPQCVIKQFYPQGQNNAGKAGELFQQEAVRLEQLGNHPQIPNLFAHFEQDSRQYIVQQFIDGQNLAQELTEKGAFSEEQIRSLLRDLLPVLKFIHKGLVIHRDIKPENIIRRKSDGRLVLVDFGAAKYATGTALAKTGTTIGTTGYSAPEQNFGQAVFASDIYSLGVTCIHLLSNIEPFDLYDAIESKFVWRQNLSNGSVSDQFVRVLDRMTHSVVKKRYQSAEAVMQALDLKVSLPKPKKKTPARSNSQVLQLSNNLSKVQTTTSTSVNTTPIITKVTKTTTAHNYISSKIVYNNISLVATFMESKTSIKSLAISPDGQKLAGGGGNLFSWFVGKDNAIRIWDINSGKLEYTLMGHSDYVESIAFSPDGEILASGSYVIKLWRVKTGLEKLTLKGIVSSKCYTSTSENIAFSPSGQILATVFRNVITLWDISTGLEQCSFTHDVPKGEVFNITSINFSLDGKLLASSGYIWKNNYSYYTVRLWDITSKECRYVLRGKVEETWIGRVDSLAFNPEGQTLAISNYFASPSIQLWDVRTGKESCSLDGFRYNLSKNFELIAYSPDGQTIATTSGNKIVLWDATTEEKPNIFLAELDSVKSMIFTKDKLIIASVCSNQTIKIWQVT